MSIERFVKDLNALSKAINNSNAVELAARTTVARMSTRIFEEGKNSDNQDIGTYSPDAGYFRGPRRGTPNNYYSQGYAQFKEAMGLGSRVNFKLFGELQNDFNTFRLINKHEAQIVLKKDVNVKKREGLESNPRFSVTFNATDEEQKLFADILEKELATLLP